MLSNFTPQDISYASHLTKLTWGDEMALTNYGLKDVLYEAWYVIIIAVRPFL